MILEEPDFDIFKPKCPCVYINLLSCLAWKALDPRPFPSKRSSYTRCTLGCDGFSRNNMYGYPSTPTQPIVPSFVPVASSFKVLCPVHDRFVLHLSLRAEVLDRRVTSNGDNHGQSPVGFTSLLKAIE